MKIKNKYIKFSIDKIIEMNLSMQTIQRELNKLGFRNLSINTFKNKNFLNLYNSWGEEKKNGFIKLIGGNANFKKTKAYLETLETGENYE